MLGTWIGTDNYAESYTKRRIRELTWRNFKKSGHCSACGRVGYTEWHHLKYEEPVLSAGITELCSFCHRKDSKRGGKIEIRNEQTGVLKVLEMIKEWINTNQQSKD